MEPLQLWGGPECTVNRTGETYRDQIALSGHDRRVHDLNLFAELGLAAIRYPVLWEKVAPHRGQLPDWSWSDERLHRLRAVGIRPIVGLVHHGSGPRYTDLLDDSFAIGLGDYAGMVAERYPWIDDWTPVNEPVTTARFSALYGLWYPHARSEPQFWRALISQIEGIIASMRAVRRVNPSARLIQTEDLGRTYSTAPLADQAAFDNARRWAGWDLLFGRVTASHPLWERLSGFGLAERLRRIADAPCPPDIVGINHYLTSDRFLDHRVERYPPNTHGSNGRQRYADTEAIRVVTPAPPGLEGALREAWQRYGTPLAITEVHNGCTREEQLRWAANAWDAACALRDEGVEVEAVTCWSLLGSQGWNTLLTAPGRYEPGVFDISSGRPRATALATLWRGLPEGATRHPVSSQPGWWRRQDRLLHRPLQRPAGIEPVLDQRSSPPLLICGANSTLGKAFAHACRARGVNVVLGGRALLDPRRRQSIGARLDMVRPWAVINAAGWVSVDDAEDAEEACHEIHAVGAIALAAACEEREIGSLNFSSDLVFDGETTRPYMESDTPRPLGAYGRSKRALEEGCLDLSSALVIRTAAVFSPFDTQNFAVAAVETIRRGQSFSAASDHVVSPSFAPALVDAALDLLIDGVAGIWHLTCGQPVSWATFASHLAAACGLPADLVEAVPGDMLQWRAPRPRFSALASERCGVVSPLASSIETFAEQYWDARRGVSSTELVHPVGPRS